MIIIYSEEDYTGCMGVKKTYLQIMEWSLKNEELIKILVFLEELIELDYANVPLINTAEGK